MMWTRIAQLPFLRNYPSGDAVGAEAEGDGGAGVEAGDDAVPGALAESPPPAASAPPRAPLPPPPPPPVAGSPVAALRPAPASSYARSRLRATTSHWTSVAPS